MERNALTAVLRANQAYCEQLAQKTTLQSGIAFFSTAWPRLPQANQFREVVVPDPQHLADAYGEATAFFAERGLTCSRWAPAFDQPPDEMATFLDAKGYRRRETLAMALREWPDLPARDDLRVLPARPMRQAYRDTFTAQPTPAYWPTPPWTVSTTPG